MIRLLFGVSVIILVNFSSKPVPKSKTVAELNLRIISMGDGSRDDAMVMRNFRREIDA